MFYVYLYLDPNSRQPFYVGKGKGNRRSQHLHEANTQRRKGQATNAKIQKILELWNQGFDPIIITAFETSEEDLAYDLERKLIAFFGRLDLEQGPLLNQTAGGNGVKSRLFTSEQREKCRQRMTGAGSPTYGVGHTEEARRKMSEAQKARCAAGNVTRHSDEHRQKLREDNAGGKATAKPVYQIDGDDLSIIREWPSSNSAAKALGLSKGNLCVNVGVEHRRKVGGYYWRLVGSTDVIDGRLVLPPKTREKHRKTLIQLSEDGTEIKEWDDLYDAAAAIGAKYHTLWAAAKYGRICGGYRWAFKP